MGMLGPGDPLSCPVNKIVVAGGSGAGKTTLCREISKRLNIPHVEIDSLYHVPECTPRPEFAADVDRITSGPALTIEYTYRSVKPLLALSWLPGSCTMPGIIRLRRLPCRFPGPR